MNCLAHFEEIWCVDFEFRAEPGERPVPLCLVARELWSGRRLGVWQNELSAMRQPPFRTDERSLFVAYYASAELGCFLALGWPMPARILDLYAEHRCHTSGLLPPGGAGLLAALRYHGIESIDASEKESMRRLVLRGGDYSPAERQAVLDYCESDVVALEELLPKMAPDIDLPRALLRGRYTAAVARMEWTGVPIDVETLEAFRDNWHQARLGMIERIDRNYGVYDGTTFKTARFEDWLGRHGILWSRLKSGQLALDDDTFKEMAKLHPAVAPLRELRTTISRMRSIDLTVGADGRNRCLLSPFSSKTGRNQPSTAKFIFGPSAWLRSLIRPEPERALAYVDYSQQELAIAAALSGDRKMQLAYESGDFYLAFAKMASAVPQDATKASHATERDRFKEVALGVLYGLSGDGIARKLNLPSIYGNELLQMHQQTFRQFWKWSDQVQNQAILAGRLETVFGWRVHTGFTPNALSLRNFPMQAHGAEVLRLACCELTESGISVCCPVHDAVLIEADAAEIDGTVEFVQDRLRRAGEIVLGGFPLRSDAKVIVSPDRYVDPRGVEMWRTVCELCGRTPV